MAVTIPLWPGPQSKVEWPVADYRASNSGEIQRTPFPPPKKYKSAHGQKRTEFWTPLTMSFHRIVGYAGAFQEMLT